MRNYPKLSVNLIFKILLAFVIASPRRYNKAYITVNLLQQTYIFYPL